MGAQSKSDREPMEEREAQPHESCHPPASPSSETVTKAAVTAEAHSPGVGSGWRRRADLAAGQGEEQLRAIYPVSSGPMLRGGHGIPVGRGPFQSTGGRSMGCTLLVHTTRVPWAGGHRWAVLPFQPHLATAPLICPLLIPLLGTGDKAVGSGATGAEKCHQLTVGTLTP